jgi:predicted O-methyltransferase YrrM
MSRLALRAALLGAAVAVASVVVLEVVSGLGSPAARHVAAGAGAGIVAAILSLELGRSARALREPLDAVRARLHTLDARSRETLAALSAWSFYASAMAGRPLYLTNYSLEPESGLWLLEAIARKGPAVLLEFGCGASTLLAAAAFKRLGSGRVVAIEEDATWKARLEALLLLGGLADHAEVHHCPVRAATAGAEPGWYDMAGITLPARVDLVLVDGPAATRHPTIRQPALPFVWDRLAEGGELLLDDGGREGEAAIAKDWTQRFADRIHAEFLPTPKGAWLIRKLAP